MNPNRRTTIGHLAILLTITLTLSIRQYVRTASVTEDSVGFIHYARQLIGEIPDADCEPDPRPRGPWATAVLQRLHTVLPALEVVERKEQHPGYPLALLAVRQTLGECLSGDPVLQWTRAGQVVSLLAGCVLTLALYFLGRHVLGPTPAFASAALLASLPAWVGMRADVLSDVSALALLTLSTLYAARLVDAGSGRQAFLCGGCAALGYLVRPEATQVAVLAGAFLAFQMVRTQGERRRLLKHGLLLVLPLLAVCLPYVFLRGSVLTKQARVFTVEADAPTHRVGGVRLMAPPQAGTPSLETSSRDGQEASTSLPSVHAVAPSRKSSLVRRALAIVPRPLLIVAAGVKKLFVEWARCLGGLLLIPILLGLIVSRREFARRPSHALLASVALLNVIVLPVVLYYKKGYIETRHVMALAALTSFWCWPGLVRLTGWALEAGRLLPAPLHGRHATLASRGAAGLLALGVGITLPATLSTPLHGERNGYRLAGAWLRGRLPDDARLFDPESLASFYAGLDDQRCWDYAHPPLTAAYLEQLIRHHDPAYLVVSDRYLRDHGCAARLPDRTQACRLLPVGDFPASLDAKFTSRVRLFQVVHEPR